MAASHLPYPDPQRLVSTAPHPCLGVSEPPPGCGAQLHSLNSSSSHMRIDLPHRNSDHSIAFPPPSPGPSMCPHCLNLPRSAQRSPQLREAAAFHNALSSPPARCDMLHHRPPFPPPASGPTTRPRHACNASPCPEMLAKNRAFTRPSALTVCRLRPGPPPPSLSAQCQLQIVPSTSPQLRPGVLRAPLRLDTQPLLLTPYPHRRLFFISSSTAIPCALVLELGSQTTPHCRRYLAFDSHW